MSFLLENSNWLLSVNRVATIMIYMISDLLTIYNF